MCVCAHAHVCVSVLGGEKKEGRGRGKQIYRKKYTTTPAGPASSTSVIDEETWDGFSKAVLWQNEQVRLFGSVEDRVAQLQRTLNHRRRSLHLVESEEQPKLCVPGRAMRGLD